MERVQAGYRTAVNLAGVEVHELARGDVLIQPGSLVPTSMIDVEVTLLPGERPLKDQARLRVHLASAEVLARLRLLGAARLVPGTTGLAQLRLESPAVAGRSDRVVLRSYSPVATIGGARVLDPLPLKRRSTGAARLHAGGRDDPRAAAVAWIEDAGVSGISVPRLAARLTVPAHTVPDLVGDDPRARRLGSEPGHFVSQAVLSNLAERAGRLLQVFHKENPLRPGMPREELRHRLFRRAPPAVFEAVLDALATEGSIRTLPDVVARADHAVVLSPAEEETRRALLKAALAAGLAGLPAGRVPPPLEGHEPRLVDRVVRLLTGEGALRKVGEGMLVHRDFLEALKTEVRTRWPPGTRVDVAAFKDLTALSRKYVIPLLEYLDRERVTRRAGQDRYVLP